MLNLLCFYMDSGDARNLTRSAQDAIRRKAVKAIVEGGMSQTMVAAVYGASRTTVCLWGKAFRLSGEPHLWMYDRFSLGQLLERTGLREVRVVRAEESANPGFFGYHRDTDPDGCVRKNDSLFMEARK